MNRCAFFFTVADPDVGLGHLYRCDALATALVQHGYTTEIIVESRSGSEWLSPLAPQSAHRLAPWLTSPGTADRLIAGCDDPVIVVDAYGVTGEVFAALSTASSTRVVFDDLGDAPPDPVIVVNGGPGAHLMQYPTRPGVAFLLGPHYQVLREPFRRRDPSRGPSKRSAVGVLLGGTDHRSLQREVVTTVRTALDPSLRVYAIGAPEAPITDPSVSATGRLSADQIATLYRSLRFLVTAAGQSVAEAVSVGLPSIMIQTADNQALNVRGWQDRGCALFAGEPSDTTFHDSLRARISDILDPNIRSSLVSAMARLDLASSTTRLVRALDRLRIRTQDGYRLTPLPLCSESQLREVLEWRTDPRVNRWMDNQNPISWEDHCSFSAGLAGDADRAFWRVDRNGTGVGVVNLVAIDRSRGRAELGLYRNPNDETVGVGRDLMALIESLARRLQLTLLTLRVRHTNIRAIRLYERVGFSRYHSDQTHEYFEKPIG